MKRIIDKQTKIFLRDDFDFNPEIEIGLEVEPAQGLYIPKWNGETWEEGATQEYIDNLKINTPKAEPTLGERLAKLETENALLKTKVATIEQTPTLKTELAIKEPIVKK